ncbi:DUF4143 domain-containing protein [Haloprofundus halobius]|uniref:DUF4143 domain-containing protein n=1 Tax=Haloprofundus halobius TaxID=2876194 RepID=UPI001CCEBB68|nr:hypothetical protein [Haloprofundus halobius]
MRRLTSERSDFIEDAIAHNSWWENDRGGLERVAEYPFRSDLSRFIEKVARWRQEDVERAVTSVAGQTGIGKTTMFLQAIAAMIEGEPNLQREFSASRETLRQFIGSVPPTQILYLPLDASMYRLETPEHALDELENVVDYFRSHVAKSTRPEYVFLDDIGAIETNDVKERLLDIVGENTYLFVAGGTKSLVDFGTWPEERGIYYDADFDPVGMLPLKFVDFVKMQAEEADEEGLESRIKEYQSSSIGEREPYIKEIRQGFETNDFESLLTAIDAFYWDELDVADREDLHDYAKEYIVKGGLLSQPDFGIPQDLDKIPELTTGTRQAIDEIVNDLIKARLHVEIHEEIAPHHSIERSERLYKLCSFGAKKSPPEYKFTELAEMIGVDRRTVGSYLDALEDALVLKQSKDFSLQKHRETRLYLRDTRHVILLSQLKDHEGFESFRDTYNGTISPNQTFERSLALTAGFDHAVRLSFVIRRGYPKEDRERVEYYVTDDGPVDFVIHDHGTVYPFILDYQPLTGYASNVAESFDPSVGSHDEAVSYEAPVRFVVTDDRRPHDGDGSLVTELSANKTLCRLPFWLYLLIC